MDVYANMHISKKAFGFDPRAFCMTILFETLFNIINNHKEKVYTFGWIFLTIVLPAKP
ncbi:hypothetical protein J23TS9_15650 [Paenibacillus sp. J23TS9]|nr:hypothetical protein J23TS9_15650 [Paenibacillus sp. J23TS9]